MEKHMTIKVGDSGFLDDEVYALAIGKNSAGIVWHIQRFTTLVECPSCGEVHEEVWIN